MIKRKKSALILFVAAMMLVLPFAAAKISVQKIDKGSSVVTSIPNAPALYDLVINNSGDKDNIELYSLAGMVIEPRGAIEIPSGETTIPVKAYPNDVLREQRGTFSIKYFIKSENSGLLEDELDVTFVDLKNVLSFSVDDLKLGDKELRVKVRNLQNTYLDKAKIQFSSIFGDEELVVSFSPYENKTLTVKVSRDTKNIAAGSYLLLASVTAGDDSFDFKSSFVYSQKSDIVSKESSEGWVMRTTSSEKYNQGNVPQKVSLEIKRDVFSRLFTIFSVDPGRTQRRGFAVVYTWEKELGPGQSFGVRATTNYGFPFFIVLLVILIVLAVYVYSRTAVIVNKRVSFVKTKGGEFALKVRVQVKARKFVEELQIIDRLPGMTQLYEKFGIKPDQIDPSTRRLIWNVERLNVGEERVFSYIVYSKMRVVGRFELPPATALFAREGKTHEVLSNRAFFVADTTGLK